jgi:hypothetical protein
MMVRWIQMVFGIQMYHEKMQVKFKYGCCPIIIEVIALGLRKLLENEFLFIFSVMVGWIQMIFGIQMYYEGMQVFLNLYFLFFKGGRKVAFSYIFNFLGTAETISMNLGRNEVLMIPYKCCISK